nr:hypothetical protein [Tanacetum cinerariifolium]
MEPINLTVPEPSGTGAEYQVDKTQSTRLRYQTLPENKGKTSFKVEQDLQTLQFTIVADIQAYLISKDELAQESNEKEVFATREDMEEDTSQESNEKEDVVKDDPALTKKFIEDTEASTKNSSTLTELLSLGEHVSMEDDKAKEESTRVKSSLKPSLTDPILEIHVPQRERKAISSDDQPEVQIKLKKNTIVKDLMTSLSKRCERVMKIPKELGIQSALPASVPEQAPFESSGRKRKHMKLEPKIKVHGLECNRSLPECVLFINNMVIKEPEYGIFFTNVFDDQAFQR